MHIWVKGQWDCIFGVLLDSMQQASTVKQFDAYGMSGEKDESDWVVVKVPQILKFNADQMKEQKERDCIKTVQSTNGVNTNSFNSNLVIVQMYQGSRLQDLYKRDLQMIVKLRDNSFRPINYKNC